jgi:hypothetical protein
VSLAGSRCRRQHAGRQGTAKRRLSDGRSHILSTMDGCTIGCQHVWQRTEQTSTDYS